MNRLRWILRILLPVVILAAGIGGLQYLTSLRKKPQRAPEEAILPVVRTHAVELHPETLVVRAHGTVAPRTETPLISEVSAKVTHIAPEFVAGGFFETGEVLVELETTDYEAIEKEALARVRRAELALAQQEADAEVARRDWEANGEGEATPLVLRAPQLAGARAELESAKAALEKARRDIERCTIRAPFPGRLRSTHVDRGQFVPMGTRVAEAHAIDHVEVRLPLAEDDLALLDLPLTFRGDGDDPAPPTVVLRGRLAGEEHEWKGSLVRTEGELDPKNRMLFAVVRVDDPYGRRTPRDTPPLLVGMFVEAEIAGRTLEATRLPRGAIRESNRVLVLRGDTIEAREVRLLSGTHEEMLVTGVTNGEQVVISPLENAVSGMRVRRIEDD